MNKINLRRLAKRLGFLGAFGTMAIVLSALLPATAFAVTTQSSTKCGTNVQCIITAGNQLITNRQNALKTLQAKITSAANAQKITSAQASTLQTDVTTNQNGLNSLKTRLDAETSAQAARTDVSNIYKQFRIYAVVLPRDYRTIEYDIELNVQTKMHAAIPAIQKALTAAPSGQQSRLNALFSDYQQQVTAAGTELGPLPNDFTAMTPSNFNQNRSSYQATRLAVAKAERTARLDLHKAAKDLQQMVKIIGHDI
jgi:septal ring factor EnvC (AmiA/AmiB activator)